MSKKRPYNKQNPQHYRSHPAGIECIDVIEPFNFNTGNVIKYVWRAGLKPGEDTLDDLKKAVWYAQRELERVTKQLELKKLEKPVATLVVRERDLKPAKRRRR